MTILNEEGLVLTWHFSYRGASLCRIWASNGGGSPQECNVGQSPAFAADGRSPSRPRAFKGLTGIENAAGCLRPRCRLFTPGQAEQMSTYSDRLFARICRMIEARFTDKDLTPSVVASEARISVRYLQKLFCARGTTCGHFIHSLRLDHASRLLQRRALSKSGQPLGEVAFACGFLDYPHFSRRFRDRFGHSPSAHSTSALRNRPNDIRSGQTPVGC